MNPISFDESPCDAFTQSAAFARGEGGASKVFQFIWSEQQGMVDRTGFGTLTYWWNNCRGAPTEQADQNIPYCPLDASDEFGGPTAPTPYGPSQGNIRNYFKFGQDNTVAQADVGVGYRGIAFGPAFAWSPTARDLVLELQPDGTYFARDAFGTPCGYITELLTKRCSYYFGADARNAIGGGTDGTITADQRNELYSKVKLYPGVRGIATWHSMPLSDAQNGDPSGAGLGGPSGNWVLTTPTRTQQKLVGATLELYPDAPTVSADHSFTGGTQEYAVFWFGKTISDLPSWPHTLSI